MNIPLRCRCGQVRGVATNISPSSGLRLRCYCKDCQAFAHFLDRPDVLDAAGGTDIFQMPPARIKFISGRDALRCVRLSAKGVFRWYAACCRTPIANSFGPRVPVMGVIHSIMDHTADGQSRDAALGHPLCSLYAGSATGPLPADAPPPPSLGIIARRLGKMLLWSLGGLGRPNPFFDEHSGAACCVPQVLTPRERVSSHR